MSEAVVREEMKALEDCVGALQFILAFYEPGQTYLDTEAWKQACARGVAAYRKAAPLVGWSVTWARAENGTVVRASDAELARKGEGL